MSGDAGKLEGRGFQKFSVTGQVLLGDHYDIEQAPRVSTTTGVQRIHQFGGSIDSDAIAPEDGSGLGQLLEFRLSSRSRGKLYIKDAGLVTSYGIFGAPGSGKTNLMLHLLRQIIALNLDDPSRRYGALILDPKASLIEDVKAIVRACGREDDLTLINTEALANGPGVNPIDCPIEAQELGELLVLAGRSAGVDARDPYWFQEWANIFAASLSILRAHARLKSSLLGPAPVTLRDLVDSILRTEETSVGPRRVIQSRAAEVLASRHKLPDSIVADVMIDADTVARFFQQNYVGTIEAFITKAFGAFRRHRLRCYSPDGRRRTLNAHGIYEDIIENGRIVHVAISPAEPALAKTLCTLVKCLFQRTVLARRELYRTGVDGDIVRPLLLACDEYSEIASEVPGQSMGDGQFLALAREFKCMALLATQSVHVLEASSLKETWRSVFSNFAAKIYMRAADHETAEAASRLSGDSDWLVTSRSSSIGVGGGTAGSARELRERRNLPISILTQVLRQGQAVVVGSLDGGKSVPGTYFLQVPPPEEVQ